MCYRSDNTKQSYIVDMSNIELIKLNDMMHIMENMKDIGIDCCFHMFLLGI